MKVSTIEVIHFGIATALLVLAASSATPQSGTDTSPRNLPRFEDYAVSDIFQGTPAAPQIKTSRQREYRTRIREGVTKGWGVIREGKEQPGPNFAGNMIVVKWGCGSPCLMMAMVDARTGAIYDPPIASNGVGARNFMLPLLTVGQSVSRQPGVMFRPDSRLMIVRATPQQTERHPSYTYYFLWQDNRWTLLRRVLLEKE